MLVKQRHQWGRNKGEEDCNVQVQDEPNVAQQIRRATPLPAQMQASTSHSRDQAPRHNRHEDARLRSFLRRYFSVSLVFCTT